MQREAQAQWMDARMYSAVGIPALLNAGMSPNAAAWIGLNIYNITAQDMARLIVNGRYVPIPGNFGRR